MRWITETAQYQVDQGQFEMVEDIHRREGIGDEVKVITYIPPYVYVTYEQEVEDD